MAHHMVSIIEFFFIIFNITRIFVFRFNQKEFVHLKRHSPVAGRAVREPAKNTERAKNAHKSILFNARGDVNATPAI